MDVDAVAAHRVARELRDAIEIAPGRNHVVGGQLSLADVEDFAEAALGATIEVPTVDGERVTFKIPPGTASGQEVPPK